MKPRTRATGSWGAVHSDLMGADEDEIVRFRPERLTVEKLGAKVTCVFRTESGEYGPLEVVDLSSTGLGVQPRTVAPLPPGSQLSSIEIQHGEATIWCGEGSVVYQVEDPQPRLGIRFTSGLLDAQGLLLNHLVIAQRLAAELNTHVRQVNTIPVEWRAGIADLRQLFTRVQSVLEELEQRARRGSWWRQLQNERAVIEEVYEKWAPYFKDVVGELDRLSSAFDPEVTELTRDYAAAELIPLLYPCPMHSRAFDKPLGYAGDYRLMTLYFTPRLEGASLYARFLHYMTLQYSLAGAVTGRARRLRELIMEVIADGRPVRVVSLACGPAVELQRLIRALEHLRAPVELFLIDQDQEALQFCHHAISKALVEHRGEPLDIRLNCLHFSVRQILKPADDAERHVVDHVLKDIDFAYSAGLLDYLPTRVAEKLLSRVYGMLNPGGKMVIGNLMRSSDTSWIMENVLTWHLQYRTPNDMAALGRCLSPAPSGCEVTRDESGLCLFLEATAPDAT